MIRNYSCLNHYVDNMIHLGYVNIANNEQVSIAIEQRYIVPRVLQSFVFFSLSFLILDRNTELLLRNHIYRARKAILVCPNINVRLAEQLHRDLVWRKYQYLCLRLRVAFRPTTCIVVICGFSRP